MVSSLVIIGEGEELSDALVEKEENAEYLDIDALTELGVCKILVKGWANPPIPLGCSRTIRLGTSACK